MPYLSFPVPAQSSDIEKMSLARNSFGVVGKVLHGRMGWMDTVTAAYFSKFRRDRPKPISHSVRRITVATDSIVYEAKGNTDHLQRDSL